MTNSELFYFAFPMGFMLFTQLLPVLITSIILLGEYNDRN